MREQRDREQVCADLWIRRFEVECAVGSRALVVLHVDAENVGELAAAEDQ
jgi:hypothetical protein